MPASIWVTDFGGMYKFNQSGSVVTSFSTVFDQGLGHDLSGCLWNVDIGGVSEIHKLNKSGSDLKTVNLSFEGFGVGVDKNDCLWIGNHSVFGKIRKTDQDGNIQNSFNPPNDETQGVGLQKDQSIWTTGSNESVYKIDQSGNIQSQTSVANAGHGMGVDERESLWSGEDAFDVSFITEFDKTGSVIFQQSFRVNGATTEAEPFTPPSVWYYETTFGTAIKVNLSGSAVTSFGAAPSSVGGLGYNQLDNNIWINDNGQLFEYTETGSSVKSIGGFSNEYDVGVGVDKDTCLWLTNDNSFSAGRTTRSSVSISKSFSVSFIDGVTLQEDQSLWLADDSTGEIARYDQNGNQTSLISAVSFAQDIGIDEDESIYVATGGLDDGFYVITKGGDMIKTVSVAEADRALATTQEPLGITKATDTVQKVSFGFTGFQTSESGTGTIQAVKAAFALRSKAGQPAKLWFDTTEQWDGANSRSVSHPSDVVSLQSGEGQGIIIPSQQNWEG